MAFTQAVGIVEGGLKKIFVFPCTINGLPAVNIPFASSTSVGLRITGAAIKAKIPEAELQSIWEWILFADEIISVKSKTFSYCI